MEISLRNYSSLLLLIAGVVLFGSSASADIAPCSSLGNSFANLSESCTIGDKTFSNFTLSGITPLAVSYSVIDQGANAIGFMFAFNLAAGPSQVADMTLGFTITAPAPTIQSAFLWTQGTVTGTGSGSITDVVGGDVLTNLASGPAVSSVLYNPPLKSVTTVQTILVAGGSGGSASVGEIEETFDQTPEPGYLLLLATGLLAMALVKCKRAGDRTRQASRTQR